MPINIKTQNEIFEELKQKYKDIDAEWDLSESSFDALLIAAFSESLGNAYELVQKAYISKDPNSADGQELRDIAYISGIKEKEEETVSNLRLRRNESVALPSDNQVDSLRAAISNIEGVTHTKVFENFENIADTNGLPPHSISLLCSGANEEDIALAYYYKKSPGVKMHAINTPISVEVISPTFPDTKLDIVFSRPVLIEVKIDLKIKKVDNLPSDISDKIKKSILSYAAGDFIDDNNNFNHKGFTIGDIVAISRLYTPINAVIGQYNTYIEELKINDVTVNLDILFNQLADFKEDNITVAIDD